MATRDLAKNSKRITKTADRLISYTSGELTKSYSAALKDIRADLVRLAEIYKVEGELTKAQATQFLRKSNIEAEIVSIMNPYLEANKELIKEVAEVGFNRGFFSGAWSVDQATGVELGWGALSDDMVRAAIGLTDDALSLTGLMSAKEVGRHAAVLKSAFTNYTSDTRRWIGREITQGVIKGESIPKIAKRIGKASLMSKRSAVLIARTEVLRATGLGGQIAYDRAADLGVKVKQIWDASLDDRTRPEHAALDGQARDETTGMFSTAVGSIPGPRRSGVAAFDINCRCTVRPEVDGFSPEVRRIRGEGIQPYKTFKEWAADKGTLKNKYGQKYSFLEE